MRTRPLRRRRWIVLAGLLVAAGGFLVGTAAPAQATGRPSAATHMAASTAITTPTRAPSATAPTTAPAGTGPRPGVAPAPGIGLGPGVPGTAKPASTVPGGAGTGSQAATGGGGLFNLGGLVSGAIDAWLSALVTSALDPVLSLLGHSLLSTPDLAAIPRVVSLWALAASAANATLVLFVLVGAAVVMGHETLQTRYAAKDIAPRIVVAAVAVNASLALAGLGIHLADALSGALLGGGLSSASAAVALRHLVVGALVGGGSFLVLLGLVVAVLAVVLLATFVIRVALTVVLVVAAPLALVCHALPHSEGLARLWWRALAACLVVQVGQALVLVTALRVFLAPGGSGALGLTGAGGLVDLVVAVCLCWVLVRLPAWAARAVFSGTGHRGSETLRVVRSAVVYKAVKAGAAVIA